MRGREKRGGGKRRGRKGELHDRGWEAEGCVCSIGRGYPTVYVPTVAVVLQSGSTARGPGSNIQATIVDNPYSQS